MKTGKQKKPEIIKKQKVKNDDKIKKQNIAKEVLEYLNEKAGTRYKPKSKANITMIYGRVGDGFTIDDFKKVIDIKCNEWLGDDKFEKFLRPSTLFRPSNFESYLNQAILKEKSHKQKQENPDNYNETDEYLDQIRALDKKLGLEGLEK